MNMRLMIVGTVLFLLCFRIPVFGSMVFFYRGIVFLLFVSVVLFFVNKKKLTSAIVVFFCVTLTWFTLLPVTAERSVSVFLLQYMNANRERIVSPAELNDVFVNTYAPKNIDKRFVEQMATRSITKIGEGYRITTFGQFLVRIFSVMNAVFQ